MWKKSVFSLGFLAIVIAVIIVCIRYRVIIVPEVPETVIAKRGDIENYATAIGYIKLAEKSVIKSQIDGIASEIYHDEGAFVDKGTPLLKVDPTPSPELYATVNQVLASAKTTEEAAKRDLDRLEKAAKKGVVGENYAEYIDVKREYENAKTLRLLAEQRLALYDVGKTVVAGKPIANVVVSPIDGYILVRNVGKGGPVLSLSSAQASTVLFVIASLQNFMFQGLVDEMDVSKLKIGEAATIKIAAMPDITIHGTLKKIGLQSEKENASTGASSEGALYAESPFNVGFKIEIGDLQVPYNFRLRSGYSATAKVKLTTARNILLLPARVINFQEGKPFVYVVVGENAKPKKQFVTLGISDGINIEIKTGINDGDVVLDKQVSDLED